MCIFVALCCRRNVVISTYFDREEFSGFIDIFFFVGSGLLLGDTFIAGLSLDFFGFIHLKFSIIIILKTFNISAICFIIPSMVY